MKRIIVPLFALFIVAGFNSAARGQVTDTVWHTGGIVSLSMAQSSFTYWAAGGQNSVALNGLVNLTANYKKDKSAWDNALTIGYGKMQQKGSDLGWVKTDNRIDLQFKEVIGVGFTYKFVR